MLFILLTLVLRESKERIFRREPQMRRDPILGFLFGFLRRFLLGFLLGGLLPGSPLPLPPLPPSLLLLLLHPCIVMGGLMGARYLRPLKDHMDCEFPARGLWKPFEQFQRRLPAVCLIFQIDRGILCHFGRELQLVRREPAERTDSPPHPRHEMFHDELFNGFDLDQSNFGRDRFYISLVLIDNYTA